MHVGRGHIGRGLALAVVLSAFATPAALLSQEQPSRPFLFLNQERILTGSEAGQALLAEEMTASDALRADARAIDSGFEEEESDLTELRPTLAPEQFRKLADVFDARVVEARREQDDRSAALALEFEQKRRQFYAQVAPLLVGLMEHYNALAIFDENSVLLADQTLDITESVIAEIDSKGLTPADPPPAGTADTDPRSDDAPSADSPPAGSSDTESAPEPAPLAPVRRPTAGGTD